MPPSTPRLLDRPVFVIGCNRSGTTLLYRTLGDHPVMWSNYEELPDVFWSFSPIHPERGERMEDPASGEEAARLEEALWNEAHNRELLRDSAVLKGLPPSFFRKRLNFLYKRAPVRFVEKTPANSLRVPFLAAAFPDARFIYLVRRPEAVISSLMEGWKFWTKETNPDGSWRFARWHYLAPPGWREKRDRSLPEICAFQWVEANRLARQDLEACCPDRYVTVRHEDLLAAPSKSYAMLREFCELPPSPFFQSRVASLDERVYTHRLSKPRPEKWKDLHEEEVESVRPLFEPLARELYPE
jgi:hypothetical protein